MASGLPRCKQQIQCVTLACQRPSAKKKCIGLSRWPSLAALQEAVILAAAPRCYNPGTRWQREGLMAATPIQTNALNIPTPPSFTNVAEERRHRKQKLAGAFRLFSRFGFDEGVAGHITARDPERTDHFWVNPFGVHFGQICVSNLILVNASGEVVEGKHPVNRAAFAIHSQVHHARPDVIAAAHAHSLYGKTWSSLGRLLDPLTQDSCAFFEERAGVLRKRIQQTAERRPRLPVQGVRVRRSNYIGARVVHL